MEIFLLRHAIAVERAEHRGPDEERALTAEGRRKLRGVAKAMRAMRLTIDIIFSSPLVRARQTADVVAQELKKRLQLTDRLQPGISSAEQVAWLKNLRPAPEGVLLVGHEPDLSELATHLLTGGRHLNINFKKAGLCKLTVQPVAPGRATLDWLLTPKQMERMG